MYQAILFSKGIQAPVHLGPFFARHDVGIKLALTFPGTKFFFTDFVTAPPPDEVDNVIFVYENDEHEQLLRADCLPASFRAKMAYYGWIAQEHLADTCECETIEAVLPFNSAKQRGIRIAFLITPEEGIQFKAIVSDHDFEGFKALADKKNAGYIWDETQFAYGYRPDSPILLAAPGEPLAFELALLPDWFRDHFVARDLGRTLVAKNPEKEWPTIPALKAYYKKNSSH